MAAVTHAIGHATPEPVRRGTPGPARRAAATDRRRYARRRTAALVVGVALVLLIRWVLGVLVPAPGTGRPARAGAGSGRVHVVRAGETLWGIARRLQPEGDVRPLVARLAARNGGVDLRPGKRLVLP